MSIQIRTDRDAWRMVPVGEIQPYERNAKIHGPEQLRLLRRSLRESGFVRPLLVDEELRLIAGHGVLEAARAEGMERVPCVVVTGLTEAQRRAYILADNKLSELAPWDEGILALELPELEALGVDVSALGFEPVPAVDFEPFDGEGDGGGSQMADGDKFRIVLGPLIFDLPDRDHSLYDLARHADSDAVAALLEARLRDILTGAAL